MMTVVSRAIATVYGREGMAEEGMGEEERRK